MMLWLQSRILQMRKMCDPIRFQSCAKVVWEVLLSMCCCYWLMNKELARPIAWKQEGEVREKP